MEPVTGMWDHLKKATGLEPDKSLLLNNCEAELQELMKQIDIMVHTQRTKWESEKQSLQSQAEHAQQEIILQKASLERKDQEIGQLRQKTIEMERNQGKIINQYELQLSNLKTEVSNMKREYEKLRKLHSKYLSKEKTKASSEMEDSVSEIRRLSTKVDDYRQKARDWEQLKRSLMKQIDSLESQKRTLADKLDLVQHQTQGYQSQLDKRRDMLTSTETNLRSQITQLEGQLERARDTINSQDTQISRLRSSLEEAMSSQRVYLEDKEQLERELRQLRNQARDLDEEMEQTQQQLNSKVDLLQVSELTQQKLSREITRLEQVVAERDHTIKTLERVSQHDQVRQIHKLQEELRIARDEAKKLRKVDRQLHEEMAHLQKKLDVSREEENRLNEDLSQKLQDKIELMEETHAAQLDGMKSQMSDLTTDLHKRNLAMAALSEKAGGMERHLRDLNETLDRKSAEVQVANAQLDALRLENRHLRKSVLRQAQGEADLEEAEGHLQELQNAYVTSLSALEEQNKKLKADISALRQKLRENEDEKQYRIQAALEESEKTLNDVKNHEERRIEDVREAGERKLEALQHRLESTKAKYEMQIQHLQEEIVKLENELAAQIKTLQKLGLEHEVMSSFVTGVDDIVQQPPHRDNSVLHDSNTHSHYSSDLLDTEDELMDSADIVAANFLAEQEERTRELERKLDMHIEGLKLSSEATIKKYAGTT